MLILRTILLNTSSFRSILAEISSPNLPLNPASQLFHLSRNLKSNWRQSLHILLPHDFAAHIFALSTLLFQPLNQFRQSVGNVTGFGDGRDRASCLMYNLASGGCNRGDRVENIGRRG